MQARLARCRDDLQLHHKTAADREALSDTEPSHLVEIDPVLVLGTHRTQDQLLSAMRNQFGGHAEIAAAAG